MSHWKTCFVAVAATFLVAAVAEGAEHALCPEPLHIVRRVSDSLSGSSVTIDDYCDGNRIVSVSKSKTTIADYERQEIVEIGDGRWSLTTFAEAATARAKSATAAAVSRDSWTLSAAAMREGLSARATQLFSAQRKSGPANVTLEIAIDRQTAVSREALEALIGASFPNRRTDLHDAVIAAAAPATQTRAATMSVAPYALPVDEILTIEGRGERAESRMTVLRIDAARVPPEVLVTPASSVRVESDLTRFARELERLDHPEGSH